MNPQTLGPSLVLAADTAVNGLIHFPLKKMEILKDMIFLFAQNPAFCARCVPPAWESSPQGAAATQAHVLLWAPPSAGVQGQPTNPAELTPPPQKKKLVIDVIVIPMSSRYLYNVYNLYLYMCQL